jgi:hypothetical protein
MNIRTITEEKIKAYLQSVTDITYPVLLGQELEQKDHNSMVIAYAPSATASDLGIDHYGNYSVKLDVHIYTDIHEGTLDSHREMTELVEASLSQFNLIKTAWESDSGFLYALCFESVEEAKDEQKLGVILHYEVFCCLPE